MSSARCSTNRPPSGRTRLRPVWRAERLETALLGFGFVVLFLFLPHELFADDTRRFADIEALLHHGRVSGGHHYSLVMPLISAPFLLLGEVVRSPEWWAARFNVVVVAVGVVAAYRLLRGRVDASLMRQVLLVLLFASLLTNRLRDYNAEVLTGTLFALGILCIATEHHVVAGWVAIVIGVVNTPGAFGALALLVVVETARHKRLRFLLPLAAAALLIIAENWLRRGGPLATG